MKTDHVPRECQTIGTVKLDDGGKFQESYKMSYKSWSIIHGLRYETFLRLKILS